MQAGKRARGIGLILVAITTWAVIPLTGCQSDPSTTTPNQPPEIGLAAPVQDETFAGGFRNLFHDNNVYFAGLPTEAGIQTAATNGIGTVINIISEPESTTRITFDEKAVVENLGMNYVFIPVTPTSFSVADVDRFAAAFEVAAADGGKVLIHCASSNRVGGMWAAYLARYRNLETEEALARGRAAGLRSDSMVAAVERVSDQ